MSQEISGTLTSNALLSGNINTENVLTGSFGTSLGSADYNDLTNKPSINNVELIGNKTSSDLGIIIPTKTSELTNDSNFITGSNLATVATSGNYNDLNHKPTIPTKTSELTNDSNFVTSSGLATVATSGSYNDLVNKPNLAAVATTGSYLSLSNKPTIPAAQVNSDWNAVSGVAQILNKPTLATVATSGDYDDLINKPTIPAAQVNSDWNAVSGVAQILNKPTLATVATSGSYSDLTNKPYIPAAQVNSDWNAVSGVAQILNKPTLATVATSGDYDDLINKPTVDTTLDDSSSNAIANSTVTTALDNKAPKSDLASISITGSTNNTGSMIKAGKFFYLNGSLVIAKTDIANGATLTENTNYETVTAGGLNKIIEVMSTTPTNISSQFTFNTSSYSDITGRVSAFYYPQLKRVFGSLACYTVTSVINTTEPLCTITSGYRPTSNLSVPAMIKLSSGEFSPYYCSMYTTGNINQQLTSSCKGVYMTFDYQLSI